MLAGWTGGELVRLQCYEGIDAAQAIYEWDHGRQLLHLRAAEAAGPAAGQDTEAPRGRAVRRAVPRPPRRCSRALDSRPAPPPVLLIDEVDRADDEFEAFLLEVLVRLGRHRPRARHRSGPRSPRSSCSPATAPATCTTPCKRRCLYHWVEHPDLRTRGGDRRRARARRSAPAARPPGGRGRRRRSASSASTSRPGSPRRSTGPAPSPRSACATLNENAVADTLGAVLKYREDYARVVEHGIADVVKRAFERSRARMSAQLADHHRARIAVAFARVLRGAGLDVPVSAVVVLRRGVRLRGLEPATMSTGRTVTSPTSTTRSCGSGRRSGSSTRSPTTCCRCASTAGSAPTASRS